MMTHSESDGSGFKIYLDIKLHYVKILLVNVIAEPRRGAMTPQRTEHPAIHTWLVLMKAHRTLSRHATRSIEALDMCFSDFAILEALLHKGPQRQGTRAAHRVDQRIDDGGHRSPRSASSGGAGGSPDHRRAWVIQLTPAGKALITKVFAGHQAAMEKAMSGLSKPERATLYRFIATARHDRRSTTCTRRRSELMTTTLDTTTTTRTYIIDKTHSEVDFQVRHLLTKVRGRFSDFTGSIVFDQEHPERSSASLTIDASSIDTGTPDRDAHLRSDDFFAVKTYPTLTFQSSRVVKTGDDTYDLIGRLTIRGIARRLRCR